MLLTKDAHKRETVTELEWPFWVALNTDFAAFFFLFCFFDITPSVIKDQFLMKIPSKRAKSAITFHHEINSFIPSETIVGFKIAKFENYTVV